MAVTTTNDGADATAATETEKAAIAPATTFSTSGAPVQIVPDVKPEHPAVDNNPREFTSVEDNAIVFNDPTKTGAQVVTERLAGMTFTTTDPVSTDKAKA